MSVKKTYRCDHCGTEEFKVVSGEPQQFWLLGVTLEHWPGGRPYSLAATALKTQACRGCVEKIGLLGFQQKPTKEVPQPPTDAERLEEVIRSMIEVVVQERTGA